MGRAKREGGVTGEPLLAQLARHLQRPVPEAVRTRARLHLLDWLACVAGALRSDIARVGQNAYAPGVGDKRTALLGNVLEMDDVHREARLHPGPVIWSSVIERPLTVPETLDCAVRGYEAMVIVGATFDDHHYAHYHPTTTAGYIGSVAAQAEVWQVEAEQLAHALSIAASVTGGLWQMRHSANDAKQLHVVFAGIVAEEACYLASRGATGPLSILEGPQGLYAATCREPKPMVLGPGWRIEEVSFKPWAACRHAHPVIDCALELRSAGKLAPPFHVETFADALTFCDKPHPATEVEAKFSLQHAVAAIADGRNATPTDFTLDAIAALAPLRAQVSVAQDPAITARYPAHFGARLNGFELRDCRGDPERPVSEADIVAKMRMLADWGGLPISEADRAADLALNSDDAGAISRMLEEWLS
jgi:2-methylcitrate dehydratase PrpD